MINKLFLVLAASALLVACKNNSSSSANAASMQVDSSQVTTIKFDEDKYDFGKVAAGEVVEHEFKFTNTGKYPLIIKSATASCGCTVPSKPEEPVMPGATASINVKFNSEGRQGLQEKNITIIANTNPSASSLRLFGEVE
ncbi:hypothetical protein D3C80_402370 [compost metagenome]